uniref:Cytochrome b n=1 Tax=Ichneumonidae sp. MT-2014 TaxID=1560014 RepID=A0A0A0S1P5_9HYME|nr:cytochrome b [Ichneumonidae sp. MT-2014]
MNKSIMKKIKLLKIINNSLINLATPSNINIWWNFGSLLGMSLIIQIITGLMLSMHYCPNINLAFNSMIHIIQNVNNGWIIQLIHMNGASMFFLCMYNHIGRGMYYSSYKLVNVWFIGIIILLLSMATAFMGYVLPWGQMSFWGATVITNLISTIPYIGQMIVEWIWGGFAINNPTLNRFYTFHFIFPFITMFMVMIHLFFIHQYGSNNPLGLNSKLYSINFHNYFTLKDIMGFLIIYFIILMMCFKIPFMLSDPDNYMIANPMLTPIHIQPEWYFLFAYSMLRAIPNKTGGVISLLMSILILFTLPFINKYFLPMTFFPYNQFMFWMFLNNFILLTWLGSQPVEEPFILLSQMLSMFYFMYFFINNYMTLLWMKLIY